MDNEKNPPISNRDFHLLIVDKFRGAPIPSVKNDYSRIFGNNLYNKFNISDKEDKKNFYDLYDVKPRKSGFGNGEVAIFWLLNYYKYAPGQFFAEPKNGYRMSVQSSEQGIEADLHIGNKNIEVKAYTAQHDSLIKLGMWTGQKEFLNLVNIAFAVDNLVNDNNASMSVKAFNYKDLARACDNLCAIRQAFVQLDGKSKKIVENFPFFNPVAKKLREFDDKLKNEPDLQDCSAAPVGPRVGFFEKKPGVGGYLVNVPGTGGNPLKERGLEITKIDINNVDLKNIAKDKAIKFSDLNLFLSFGKIFKK